MKITRTARTLAALFVLRAIEAQPNVTAWEILNQGVVDKNPQRRKQAIAALASIGVAPESIKLLESALLDDEDIEVRKTAAASLGQMKARQSMPALEKALDDPSGEVAFQAAKSLWELGNRSAKGTLKEVLTGERKDATGLREGAMRDAKAKLHSPRALAKIGVREASGALLGPFALGVNAAEEMMKDTGAPGRAEAATLLAHECDEGTLQLLNNSLQNDKNAAVKAAAARGVGSCGAKDSIPVLERHLADSQDVVKFMAAAAIVKLSMGSPVPAGKN